MLRAVRGRDPPAGSLWGRAQKSRRRDDGSNVVVRGEKGMNGVERAGGDLLFQPASAADQKTQTRLNKTC